MPNIREEVRDVLREHSRPDLSKSEIAGYIASKRARLNQYGPLLGRFAMRNPLEAERILRSEILVKLQGMKLRKIAGVRACKPEGVH